MPPAGTVGGLSVRSGLQPGLAGGKNDVTGAGAVGTQVERLERQWNVKNRAAVPPKIALLHRRNRDVERLERLERL